MSHTQSTFAVSLPWVARGKLLDSGFRPESDMGSRKLRWSFVCALIFATSVAAQEPQVVHGGDERYKVDILEVVAHPDDEGFFTPYLARAIHDMHKRVAVVFGTQGGSGANHYSRERGPALTNVREIEAREACARLGITLVWFLDGKDTASQDVLDSLSNWGHGANLERLVGLIRLTRPEVILTHFPGIFVGEDHGDHQATGVLVTEAFDLAANPTAFPAQLSGTTKHRELYLSNLQPWQPKKIYYGSDANDGKQFDGTGPAYSVKEISPALGKSYARLAIDAALPHLTQFPDEIERISKMSDAEVEKLMSDPDSAWWSEPSTLIFGKSVVGGKPTDDVFAYIDEKPGKPSQGITSTCANHTSAGGEGLPRLALGGPWAFYEGFYPVHGLCALPIAKAPEIGIKTGTDLMVPLVVIHEPSRPLVVNVKASVPEGWKVTGGVGRLQLPAEESTSFPVHIETPTLPVEELKKGKAQEVRVSAEVEGKPIGEVSLRVVLRALGLPQ
jgi:LmbE family N-acetylglucosaminyl deacetylase